MFLGLLKLPESDPIHRILVSTLRRQVDALLLLQDPATGLWRTLLDDETSYVESSGTAGFVGGMLMAIRQVSIPSVEPLLKFWLIMSGIPVSRQVSATSSQRSEGLYRSNTTQWPGSIRVKGNPRQHGQRLLQDDTEGTGPIWTKSAHRRRWRVATDDERLAGLSVQI
jgi:hypothetical protein